MNHSSPTPGNHRHTGKYDAFIVPDSELSDVHFELTALDKEIPSFKTTPDQPVKQPLPPPPLTNQNEQNRSPLPSYSTGGASGYLVQRPPAGSPPTRVSPVNNDAPVSFEIRPDSTRDRSLRHDDTGLPSMPPVPADTEVHIPVGDTPQMATPSILKNDLSSYWKQPSAGLQTGTPNVSSQYAPVRKSPEPGTTTSLSHTATPGLATDNALSASSGPGINFNRYDTTRSATAAAPRPPDNNRYADAASHHTTVTPDRPADTEVHIPVVDAPPAILKKDRSTHSKQPPTTVPTGMPDAAHHALPPVARSPESPTPTTLSPTVTPDRLADDIVPEPTGHASDLAMLESAAQAIVAQLPADENPPDDLPIGHAAFVSPEISNPDALDCALQTLILTIPLLSEDELLTSLAETQNGGFMISPKTLKQALIRTGFETDYKRYRAYITG